jgi:hypothetical protein
MARYCLPEMGGHLGEPFEHYDCKDFLLLELKSRQIEIYWP